MEPTTVRMTETYGATAVFNVGKAITHLDGVTFEVGPHRLFLKAERPFSQTAVMQKFVDLLSEVGV